MVHWLASLHREADHIRAPRMQHVRRDGKVQRALRAHESHGRSVRRGAIRVSYRPVHIEWHGFVETLPDCKPRCAVCKLCGGAFTLWQNDSCPQHVPLWPTDTNRRAITFAALDRHGEGWSRRRPHGEVCWKAPSSVTTRNTHCKYKGWMSCQLGRGRHRRWRTWRGRRGVAWWTRWGRSRRHGDVSQRHRPPCGRWLRW